MATKEAISKLQETEMKLGELVVSNKLPNYLREEVREAVKAIQNVRQALHQGLQG